MGMVETGVRVLRPEGFKRMAYTQWGDPHGREVVVCVHGLTRQGRDFDVLAERLATDLKRRVLCPDVLGRGKSDWLIDKSGYTYPLYLADMAALIARSGAEQVDWVGTSMGGLIGLMLAATPNSPIRRLVINDIGPLVPWEGLARIGAYVGENTVFPEREAAEARLKTRTATYGPMPPECWPGVADHSLQRTPDGEGWQLAYDPAIAQAFQAIEPGQPIDLWALWDQVQVPVLVVRGAESDLLPVDVLEEMKRRGPGCQVLEVAAAGHAPWLMSEDQVAPVMDFLRRSG